MHHEACCLRLSLSLFSEDSFCSIPWKHQEKKKIFWGKTFKKSETRHAMQEVKENIRINVKAMDRLMMGGCNVIIRKWIRHLKHESK